MGQAVDLPDPAQASASAAATSADDLLSQLAGDEIDRLLAESDAETAAQAKAQPAVPATPQPAESEPAAPSATTPPAAVAESPVAPAPSPPATEGLADELDSLLSQAVAKDAAPATAGSPASAEATPTAEPTTAVDAKALDASLAAQATPASTELQATVNEIETSLQERSGLTDSTAGDPALEAVDNTPVPLYLKPLVWLNSPLMVLPEPIRDAIGKIAVLTLFNSVAVLAYVLMFRRHHH